MDSSSIDIRPLTTHEELAACVELQYATWGNEFSDAVPASILKVSQRIGGIAAGAFDEAGALLGFVFGLTGIERGRVVHWSDMLAVKPEARGLGLGRRLKEHQRAAVRELGGDVIYWTFDPLVARNAHLNFNKLGVRLVEYAEDMYGGTNSVLHGSVPTDRLVVAWSTHDIETRQRLDEADRILGSPDCRQAPVATPDWIDGAAGASILPYCVRVEIPLDGEDLLTRDPTRAAECRHVARAALQWALCAGYTIGAVLADDESERAFYLLTKLARPTLTANR